MSLKWFRKTFDTQQAIEKSTQPMRNAVKQMDDLQKSTAFISVLENIDKVHSAIERSNPVQQYIDQMEQEKESLQRMMHEHGKATSGIPEASRKLIENAIAAKRDKAQKERQEEAARHAENVALQKAQLESSNRQNRLMVIGIWVAAICGLITIVGILVGMLLSESFRSWLAGWFM